MRVKIIQLEVSSKCDSSCIYCPHTLYRKTWPEKIMNLEVFSKVVDEAKSLGTKYLHLQGWGEPLLHPDFTDIVKGASRHFSVGFTTNGKYLTEKVAREIVNAGVDLVAITFAGAHRETHDKIRVGNNFDIVIRNLRELIKITREKTTNIKVVAIFMMLRDTYRELPDFIRVMADIGIEEIKLSNLTYLPTPELSKLKVFSRMFEPPPQDVVKLVEHAREIAKEIGVKVRSDLFTLWEQVECPEKPTETLYVSVDGDVHPCVYLGLPLETFSRCFENKCETMRKVTFGNLKCESLRKIVEKESYREFVLKFERRKRCSDLMLPDPPEVCRRCYRLYGV